MLRWPMVAAYGGALARATRATPGYSPITATETFSMAPAKLTHWRSRKPSSKLNTCRHGRHVATVETRAPLCGPGHPGYDTGYP